MKKELYEREVAPTLTYGAEVWVMRMDKKHKLDLMEMNCLRSICVVTRMDRWRNGKVRREVGVREKMV